MTILVVDDETLARKRVRKLISEANVSEKIYEASSGKEAIHAIRNLTPDIVFLDIEMTDMTGFDVLKEVSLEQMPIIIFVTAFDNFAVQAFEVQAIDFLLKPYKKERFLEALNRAIGRVQSKGKAMFSYKVSRLIRFLENENLPDQMKQVNYLDRVVLKIGKKYYFVPTDTIKYIISSAYYAEIYTKENKKHLYRISMSDFIKKLDPHSFIRVNRSTIVNLTEVKEVISEGQGDYSIVMRDTKSFSLSKKYRVAFLASTHIK